MIKKNYKTLCLLIKSRGGAKRIESRATIRGPPEIHIQGTKVWESAAEPLLIKNIN